MKACTCNGYHRTQREECNCSPKKSTNLFKEKSLYMKKKNRLIINAFCWTPRGDFVMPIKDNCMFLKFDSEKGTCGKGNAKVIFQAINENK